MTAMERKGKDAACELIKTMCEVSVDDVSGADDQCESLIGAITVWIFVGYSFDLCSSFTDCNWFRIPIRIQYVMKLG